MNDIVRGLLAEQEWQAKESITLNLLLREKRQTDNALENVMKAIELGIISNTTNKRLHELESKQEELERQILIEKSKQSVKISEREIRTFYENAIRLEPQLLIDALIKEILLYDDRIEIYFNSPTRTSPDDENRGFSFYRGTQRRTFKDPHKSEWTRIILEVVMKL